MKTTGRARAEARTKWTKSWLNWPIKLNCTWKCYFQQTATMKKSNRALRPYQQSYKTWSRTKSGSRSARSKAFIWTLADTATCTYPVNWMKLTMQARRTGYRSYALCWMSCEHSDLIIDIMICAFIKFLININNFLIKVDIDRNE